MPSPWKSGSVAVSTARTARISPAVATKRHRMKARSPTIRPSASARIMNEASEWVRGVLPAEELGGPLPGGATPERAVEEVEHPGLVLGLICPDQEVDIRSGAHASSSS